MPALIWLGRRWHIGSDDFTLVSLSFSVLLIFSWILTYHCFQSFDCSTTRNSTSEPGGTSLSNCTEILPALERSILALLTIVALTVVSFLLTGVVSMRGAVHEESKRRLVPFLLYTNAIFIVSMLAAIIVCFKYIVTDKGLDAIGNGAKKVMLVCLSLDLIVFFAYIVFFALVFDSSGRKTYSTFEEYEVAWVKRFSILCCAFTKAQKKNQDFQGVAKTLAQAFCAYDIVPSDVAGGLLLLHGYQKCSRRIISQRVSYAPLQDGWDERVASEARSVLRLTDEQREIVRELGQYFCFSRAILGWMFYEYTHCGYGLCKLCCLDPLCCCHHPGDNHHGCKNGCNLLALQEMSGLLRENIIVSNWKNSPFKPVYFVAHDPISNTVVIAMRGTMSLADCITDLTVLPVVIQLNDIDDAQYNPEDYYVHFGMFKSARYVLEELESQGVLEKIQSAPLADAKIRITGHSLGAGVALLLSVLLWSSQPALRSRLRCLAYAPPGVTMSKAVQAYCQAYTVGCFLGYDLVPRLAPHTFDDFRESLFNALAASHLPKALLFLNAWRTRVISQSFHPSGVAEGEGKGKRKGKGKGRERGESDRSGARGGNTEALLSEKGSAYRVALREGACAPPPDHRRLYPCATLVHLRKVVVRTPGGWVGSLRRVLPCCVPEEVVYIPCFEGTQEVQVILASPSMVSDHMPDRMSEVLSEAVCRMNAGELERFYVDELPEDVPEDLAPMRFIGPEFEEFAGPSLV